MLTRRLISRLLLRVLVVPSPCAWAMRVGWVETSRPTIFADGILLLLTLAVPSAQLFAQEATKTQSPARYENRREHDPNGIGKFYMGREIAMVMGHQAAGWLERPEREKEEEPDKVLKVLDIKPGASVADVGAGSGYFTFRLAKKVGKEGKVYAVDIQEEMLERLRRGAKKEKLENIVPIMGKEDDPRLPAAALDLILMVDVYHEFEFPYEMTQAMVKALKPGGRIVFVEYRKEDPEVWIKLVHKMTEKQVRKEMEVHNLRWVKTSEVLPTQHIVIFEKPEKEASGKN